MRCRHAASLIAVCLAGVLTGGCELLHPIVRGDAGADAQLAETPVDLAELRLAEAAERAEAALSALARIEFTRATPLAVAELPPDVSPALRRPVTLDWIGPVETLVETLATRARYRFARAGAPPVRPVMVAVMARKTPLIEVLRDAGMQAGKAATIVVDAARRTVRLDWAPQAGSGGT